MVGLKPRAVDTAVERSMLFPIYCEGRSNGILEHTERLRERGGAGLDKQKDGATIYRTRKTEGGNFYTRETLSGVTLCSLQRLGTKKSLPPTMENSELKFVASPTAWRQSDDLNASGQTKRGWLDFEVSTLHAAYGPISGGHWSLPEGSASFSVLYFMSLVASRVHAQPRGLARNSGLFSSPRHQNLANYPGVRSSHLQDLWWRAQDLQVESREDFPSLEPTTLKKTCKDVTCIKYLDYWAIEKSQKFQGNILIKWKEVSFSDWPF